MPGQPANKFESFKTKLYIEIKSRELDKEKGFKAANMRINLPKFKGNESTLDIYIFKDKLEKTSQFDNSEKIHA